MILAIAQSKQCMFITRNHFSKYIGKGISQSIMPYLIALIPTSDDDKIEEEIPLE